MVLEEIADRNHAVSHLLPTHGTLQLRSLRREQDLNSECSTFIEVIACTGA
jgi:hypothetical protein